MTLQNIGSLENISTGVIRNGTILYSVIYPIHTMFGYINTIENLLRVYQSSHILYSMRDMCYLGYPIYKLFQWSFDINFKFF